MQPNLILAVIGYLFIGLLIGYAFFDTQMKTGRKILNPNQVLFSLLITAFLWPLIIMVALTKK